MDLLLFFIKRDEVDIYDIPIAQIADEYLAYVRVLEEIDLDGVAGETGMAEELIYSISANPVIILLMVNLVMILIGMLMDDISGLLLSAPLLLPIVTSVGMDPVHFAAVLGVNLGMANITPPKGVLKVAAMPAAAKAPVWPGSAARTLSARSMRKRLSAATGSPGAGGASASMGVRV